MTWLEKLKVTLQPAWRGSMRQDVTEPMTRNVLLIIHAPRVPSANGRRLYEVLRWHQPDDLVAQYIKDVREASGGFLQYTIAERVEVDAFPVKADGFVYDADTYLYRWRSRTGYHVPDVVDYARLLQQFKVVPKINLGHADEVWLMGFPYAGYHASVMVGPGAFHCSAPPLADVGRCARRFVVMGFSYEQGVAEMLERFGQRAESIMTHVFRRKRGGANLWQQFARHEQSDPGQSECGTMRFAPNSERAGEWGNGRYVRSFCDNWLQFPEAAAPPRRINCGEWGGGDPRAHHLWWLRHLPRAAGERGGISHNWWLYVANPDLVR